MTNKYKFDPEWIAKECWQQHPADSAEASQVEALCAIAERLEAGVEALEGIKAALAQAKEV
ncbi:hypothetical protein LCGC14_1767710 [marine sediment metagenome]|uniref:Uncharacterized protein n=1 Tax=marine sediment metagenome TaxID=412755 RepID=A0A0F9JYW1_9ZZZZ